MKKIKLSIFQIIVLVLIIITIALWTSIIFTEPGTDISDNGGTVTQYSKIYSIIV